MQLVAKKRRGWDAPLPDSHRNTCCLGMDFDHVRTISKYLSGHKRTNKDKRGHNEKTTGGGGFSLFNDEHLSVNRI